MRHAGTLVLTLLVVSTAFMGLAQGAAVTTEPTKLDTALVGASGAMANGKLYIFGGRDSSDGYSADVRMYDPVAKTISTVAQFPTPPGGPSVGGSAGRYSGTAVAFGSKIFFFGGTQIQHVNIDASTDGSTEPVPRALRDIFEFDPATNNLRLLSDKLPVGAWGMAGASTTSAIYLFGGFTFDFGDLANTGRHDWVLRFTPNDAEGSVGRVTTLDTKLLYGLQDAAAASIGRRIFIMGGLSDHDAETNPCTPYEYFDPETNSQQTAQPTVCVTKRIMSFDPTFDGENVVGVAGELPYRAQFIHAAVVNGKAYVSGALLSDGSAVSSIIEVTPTAQGTPQTRVILPTLPMASFGQAVATDGETVLIAGGRTGGTRDLTDAIVRLDPRPTPPWAPRSATATEIAGGGVRLTWETPSYNGDSVITGYRVYRTPVGGIESKLTETTSLSFDDTTVRPGSEYSWRVSAVNAIGESAQSARVSRSSGVTVPGEVSAFSAFPDNNAVLLRWRAPEELGGANLTGYRILRDNTVIASPPPDAREYVDRTATNGQTYTYQVRAVNTKGEGALSHSEIVTPANVPPPPSTLVAEVIAVGEESRVRLTWAPASGTVDHYVVSRSSLPGRPPTFVWNVSETSYTDNQVERGRTYYYTVASANDVGVSTPSREESVALVRTPGPPGDVAAVGLDGEVRLTWSAPTNTGDAPENALRYYVSRQGGGSSRAIIIKTDIEGTTYIDRQVSAGTTYTYTVTTLNPMASEASAPATATPRAILNKPPVALLSILPPLTNAGDPVELDASQSSDIDNGIRTYTFDFGDGSDPVTTEQPTVSHQYAFNGTFTATVIATDTRGEISEPASAQVIVGETVGRNVETGLPGKVGNSNRTSAPGSQAGPVPGIEPLIAIGAIAALALLLRRRRPQ